VDPVARRARYAKLSTAFAHLDDEALCRLVPASPARHGWGATHHIFNNAMTSLANALASATYVSAAQLQRLRNGPGPAVALNFYVLHTTPQEWACKT
jgi:hypothetical protein